MSCTSDIECHTFETCAGSSCIPGVLGTPCQINNRRTRSCLPTLTCVTVLNSTTSLTRTEQKNVFVDRCQPSTLGSSCTFAHQCSLDLICGSSGKCTRFAEGQPCNSDIWCPPHAFCSKRTKTCTYERALLPMSHRVLRSTTCKDEYDCLEHERCINGVCLNHLLHTKCSSQESCPSELRCINGICEAAGLGAECSLSTLSIMHGKCYPGLRCLSNRCVYSQLGDSCFESDTCTYGSTCISGKCIAGSPGVQCADDNDCSNLLSCVEGICSKNSQNFQRSFVLREKKFSRSILICLAVALLIFLHFRFRPRVLVPSYRRAINWYT